jgi:UDP-N-acetylglucosamine diphosphorylase/glucosamine-1-phosphate N-acetyltransferase
MNICIYEDDRVGRLDPLTLTHPAFDLWCGTSSLLDRQRRYFAATQVGAMVRPALAELCQARHAAHMAVNDPAWLAEEAQVLVNARWLPPAGRAPDLRAPQVALVGDQVAYVVRPPGLADCAPETVASRVRLWKQTLPQHAVGGAMIDYAWDLVGHNGEAVWQDWAWRRADAWGGAAPAAVVGPAERALVHPSATVEPMVVLDTRPGPIIIDGGAVVQAFSRLEGPCYVGPHTWVVGAKVRGSSFGPHCRLGGEVEASIVQGYSNKYHDGFLGHSYLGEWVNLGAGTQTSDLRNDYGPVEVTVDGERVVTGQTKVGAFVGDHTKSGIGTLLNTGTVVGAFAQLLPTGSYLPRVVPSFCQVWRGQLRERTDLRQLLGTAAAVLRRRGAEWGPAHTNFVFTLHEETMPRRRDVIRASEQRRLRNIV